MSQHQLATYLNDHLAGAVVAIRLMESLESTYGDDPDTREIADVVRSVRLEVESERVMLHEIVSKLGTSESALRKTAGWFAERFGQLKLAADDGGDGAFRMLESTEIVALGILGKRGLWCALRTIADSTPEVQGIDFDELVVLADSQHARMELLRLGAARAALAAETPRV